MFNLYGGFKSALNKVPGLAAHMKTAKMSASYYGREARSQAQALRLRGFHDVKGWAQSGSMKGTLRDVSFYTQTTHPHLYQAGIHGGRYARAAGSKIASSSRNYQHWFAKNPKRAVGTILGGFGVAGGVGLATKPDRKK